jgi:diguanylate cyclase (GGDEF)-like protein
MIAAVALISLEQLNTINTSIINEDIPLIKSTDRLIDSVYNQERHGRRYAILQGKNMMDLFKEEAKTFRQQLQQIGEDKNIPPSLIKKINQLHGQYYDFFLKWFDQQSGKSGTRVNYENYFMNMQGELIRAINDIAIKAESSQSEKMITTSMIGIRAFRNTVILCLLSFIIGIGAAILMTRSISRAIKRLSQATTEIAKGNFTHVPDIKNQDELGDLAQAFTAMGRRLKRLEEMYLDASPLTHLPGGIAIENVLKKRIAAGESISFCLVDLDHFKAYNDKYGYAKGNHVIKATARLLEEAVNKKGCKNCYVGHIGGDDFVIITKPEFHRNISEYIIESFDKMIKKYYSKQDMKLGYISGMSRSGKKTKYPIMTITVAVVTNKNRPFKHYVQVGEKAAELKEYGKTLKGSKYVVDRRKSNNH